MVIWIYTDWDRLLGPINWRYVFLYMYQNHIGKRITDVQYKHIHGKLAPHLTLYYSKIQGSSPCTRCREFPAEFRHIFLDCPLSQRMWKIVTYHLFIITSKPHPTPTFFEAQIFIVVGFVDSSLPHPLFKRQMIYALLSIFPF